MSAATDSMAVSKSIGASDWLFNFPCVAVVLGAKFSGKTNFLLNVLDPDDFTAVWLVTATYHTGSLAQLQDDKDFVLPTNTLTDGQLRRILEEAKAEKEKDGHASPRLILFDDFIGSQLNLPFSKAMEELVTSGRHSNITVVFSSQYYKKVPTVARQNMEYFVIFRVGQAVMDHLITEVTPGDLTKDEFKAALDHVSGPDANFDYIFNDRRENISLLMQGSALELLVEDETSETQRNPLYDFAAGR